MDKRCVQCNRVFFAKTVKAKFCSDSCRISNHRGIKFEEQEPDIYPIAKKLGLPPLDKVDRTKAFSEEDMEKIRKLPRELWLEYMARPNSADVMTKEEITKHYTNKNFPPVDFVPISSGSAKWGV